MQRVDIYDAMWFVGLLVLSGGVWMLNEAAALIVFGGALMAIGLLGARNGGSN